MTHLTEAAEIITGARRIVVLTGAGISTESRIRDFRSRMGLYQEAPEYILSLRYFFDQPHQFYQFALENLYHPDAKPNKGHEILAKWEKEGRISQIITQNIDGLHQKAGSQHVIEFHGTMNTATCVHCGSSYTSEEMFQRYKTIENFYVCSQCETRIERDRYIKPDVVLFGDAGEWFTPEGFQTILSQIEAADCLLVLGSSLKVVPFASFPKYRTRKVPMILVNLDATQYDKDQYTYAIHEPIGKTLEQIDKFL